MINDTITLNFEIEKGEPIAGQSHFSARIKLTNESKNLLCEKLGSTVQFGNLDNYFSLNPENFYIYYNQYADRDELYVRDDNSRYLASNLPLNHNGFSIELSTDRASIVDYGFYPLAVIYNPRYYNKAEEKAFDDHGKLLPIASSMLDTFLSNTNGLTTQDIFLQIQNEIAEKEARLVREKRQAEEELDRKNEELKGLIEKGDITLFKVVKGHDIGDGRSAVILQRDGEEVILDSSKYYIAEYKPYSEWKGDEYLNFVSPGSDMLVDYENLFFVLNQGSYSGFESGFYSADRSDPNNYAKYSKDRYLGGDQLSEKLLNELGKDNRQAGMLDDQPMNEEVMVESEAKSRKKRVVEEDDKEDTIGNINETNEVTGATSLHTAASSGNLGGVIKLIEHSANVDARDKVGQTPLHYAIKSGNTEIAKYLIDKGANLDAQDTYYEGTDYSCFKTPLHYAVRLENIEIVKYLMMHGANPNIKDAHGNKPLNYAEGDADLVKCLVDNGTDANVHGSLFHFVELGNLDMVRYLVEHGADLSVKNTSAQTLLYCAIKSGSTEVAKYFIDYGVGIDTRDINSGKSPLHFAISTKNMEVAKHLINHDADINAKDGYGETPLHLAVNLANKEMVEQLIKRGADINSQDSDGWTPLIHAVRHGQLDIVKYLVKNNADVNVLGKNWNTLLEHAEFWIGEKRILKNIIDNEKYADDDSYHQKRLKEAATWEKTGKDMLDYLRGIAKNTTQEEESNYIDQMQADSSSYVANQPALQSDLDYYADMEKALQEALHREEIRKQNNEKAKRDIEAKKLTVKTENSNNKVEEQAKSRQKRATIDEDEQEEVVITSVVDSMKDDTEEDLNHPLKIKVGEPIGVGKYKAVLQAQDQDIDNFYQNLSSQYTAGKYNYDQAMALYNKVYIQDSKLDGKPIVLSEAYVTNDRLFIKDQDFGTINDFNEMFYKSDEFI
ncbi:MAG: ankyrin repeat domain-containing protein [Wolbachia sp.]